MNGTSRFNILRSCLFGLALIAGCKGFSAGEGSPTRPMLARSPARQAPAVTQPQDASSTESPYTTLASETVPAGPEQASPAAQSEDAAVVQASHERPVSAEATASEEAPAAETTGSAASVLKPEGLPTPSELPPSGLAHALDYTWLCGQVQHSRLAGGWVLRYSSLADDDEMGGSVVLVDHADLDRLTDGKFVVVRGHLINPESKNIPHTYRVDAFRVIERNE
jgi:hypothetical protein